MKFNIRSWDTVKSGIEGLPIAVPNDPGNWYLLAALKTETDNKGFLLLDGDVSELASPDGRFAVRIYCTEIALMQTPTLLTTSINVNDWEDITGGVVKVAKSTSNNLINMAILHPNAYHLGSVVGRGRLDSSSIGVHEQVDWTQPDQICLIAVSSLEPIVQKYHATFQWLEEG